MAPDQRNRVLRLITYAVVFAVVAGGLYVYEPPDKLHFAAAVLHVLLPTVLAVLTAGELLWPTYKRWKRGRKDPIATSAHGGKLLKAWRTALASVKDDDTKSLLAAFLARYADAEIHAILGTLHEDEKTFGRKHVVTTFITYSALVTAVVAQAKRQYKDHKIVCFTTLPMPLPRWFNYRTNLGDDSLGVIEADSNWEHYKKEIWKLLQENEIDFRRCLLATDMRHDEFGDFAIKTKADVHEYARYSILVPHTGQPADPVDYLKLAPYTWKDIAPLISGTDDKTKALRVELEAYFKKRNGRTGAYVIHEGTPDSLPEISNHVWRSLWLAFEGSAHRFPSECRFHSFNEGSVREWFSCASVADRVPEDVFAIGVKGPADIPEWKFFLAGDVGREIARVTLEFVIAGEVKGNHRYDRLKEFANTMWKDSQTVANVFETTK